MKCINCGQPIVGQAIKPFGGLEQLFGVTFNMSQSCENTGNILSDLLENGLEVEVRNPKTGAVTKHLATTKI